MNFTQLTAIPDYLLDQKTVSHFCVNQQLQHSEF
jgi:hypothetical protein